METAENDLKDYLARHRPSIDRSLELNLPLAPDTIETKFNEATRYAVFPGGKRLRPALTLLGAELCGNEPANVLNAAAAVEFVHTSSLIFDDLPGMDNSRERRGRAALHEKYGEGLASLVAIGLLNQSYSLALLSAPDARTAGRAVAEIVSSIGPAGMIGGQSIDLRLREVVECRVCTARLAGRELNKKTSALISLALRLGAVLSDADDSQLDDLTEFAEHLGDAYQISDDIIDEDEDAAESGAVFTEVPDSPAEERLSQAIHKAKSVLTNNFTDCPARDRLFNIVDYVAGRPLSH